jgi:hypothetical protein
LGHWQLQARFVAEGEKHSIHFERFGADRGDANFEPTPNSGNPKGTVLTMQAEMSNGEAFWRISDGQTLNPAKLVRRIVNRLQTFRDKYGMSIIAPSY